MLRMLLAGCLMGGAALAATNTPTFTKDILPILQKTARSVIGRAKSRPCRF